MCQKVGGGKKETETGNALSEAGYIDQLTSATLLRPKL